MKSAVLDVGRLSGDCADNSGPDNAHPLDVLGARRLSEHYVEHLGPGIMHALDALGFGDT